MEMKHIRWLALGGAAAMLIASFLPWAKLTAVFIGSITKSGMDGGDGIISVAAGVVAGIAALQLKDSRPNNLRWVIAAAGAVGLVLFAYEALDILGSDAELEEDGERFGTITLGSGLYLLAAGAIASVASAFVPLKVEPRRCAEGHANVGDAAFCTTCGTSIEP